MTASLNILVTMDCEPTTTHTHASATGPTSWASGEQAVLGYAEIARSYGFPVSYFVHPETIAAQADLFKEMARQGASVGLHMHPWKYAMARSGSDRFLEHFGGLDEETQRALLEEAMQTWAEAMGRQPESFRPGSFSANDATFRVLSDLGFRTCSCSLPGRQMPEMRANWTGTVLDPHRAHPSFRQIAGNLDLAEIPLTVDTSRLLAGKIGGAFHPDLRPDIDWSTLYGLEYDQIAESMVEQIVARAPAVSGLQLITHNHYDFSDPSDAACIRLRRALDAVVRACERASIQPVGATISSVGEAVLALPVTDLPFVCEGNLYGQRGEVGTLARAGDRNVTG
jgi:peptidoglycan/xylan/chitin deacetylase (PgdA/CDA1 family)